MSRTVAAGGALVIGLTAAEVGIRHVIHEHQVGVAIRPYWCAQIVSASCPYGFGLRVMVGHTVRA